MVADSIFTGRTLRLNIYAILIILGLIYFSCSLFGYGNDSDTYAMIRTWKLLSANHVYFPSRPPGYLVPEMVIGATSEIGGFYLANIMSVFLALAALFLFYQLIRPLAAEPLAVLGVLVVGLNPFWVIAASSSIDFVYGAFFFLLGCYLLANKRILISGLFFGLAASSRISYGPLSLLALILVFLCSWEDSSIKIKVLWGIAIFLFTSGLLYLPSFISANLSLGFLHIDKGVWRLVDYASRIIYKNIYLWGLPSFLFIIIMFCKECAIFMQQKKACPTHHLLFWGGLLAVFYIEILFAWLPAKISYLIPILFIIVWAAIFLDNAGKIFKIIIILNIIYMFINFDILAVKYSPQGHWAVAATPGFFIKKGPLLEDLLSRGKSQKDYWQAMVENRLEYMQIKKALKYR